VGRAVGGFLVACPFDRDFLAFAIFVLEAGDLAEGPARADRLSPRDITAAWGVPLSSEMSFEKRVKG
jgi:hypothetical protein